ncbi:protein phosphatase 2C domain-containing protein [Streptomyces bathyalis]|uniref:Protein phosphatase 2C domain-containing protein n=1 Tax=Streptomyces bathyalis TaxID=2710756 RepID=A0A7T1WSP1_9ACTN|nr:protein phosphatase 2C domain-containing protein [Streptomyces bathyalis]QPP05965.1 protein phosphatase 2C domain-containing protein [Streptomyces bathyalis]
MSQQGWSRNPHSGQQDDWWSQLYDPGSPDTGRGGSGDTLDDRYASVRRTVGPGTAPGGTGAGRTARPDERDTDDGRPEEESGSGPSRESDPGPSSDGAAGTGDEPGTPAEEPPPDPDPDADADADPDADLDPDPRPRADAPGSPQAPPAQDPPPGQAGSLPTAAGLTFPAAPPSQYEVPAAEEADGSAQPVAPLRPDHVGDRPPTYEAEPATFPAADPSSLSELVPDTVLDGAHYGGLTLRAASIRGDSARHRGALRRDALLTARFGSGESALLLVAVAAGGRAATGGHRAAREICHSIGGVVGRSHARLAEDIRADRRSELKSGLQRLTDRCYGKLRAQAAAWEMQPEEYTADLRCLLLSADPRCRTRVFFGAGEGGLFLLRAGAWREIEPGARPQDGGRPLPIAGSGADAALNALDPSELGDPAALSVPLGPRSGSRPEQKPDRSGPTGRREADPPTMDLSAAAAGARTRPPLPQPARPEPEPFRFSATVSRRGDTLLLCSPGLAEPLRAEPPFAHRLAQSWNDREEPPGLAAFLADVQLRVRGYADDRTAVAVWES